MENAAGDVNSPHPQHMELEQLERLLTPVQRALPGPLVAPSSAPAASSHRPNLRVGVTGNVAHAPFVSPASVAELYGLTPSSNSGARASASASAGTFENKLSDLTLPALALPATLAGAGAADAVRAEEAYRYVLLREPGALEHLLSHIAHGGNHASRLHHALRVRARGSEEARYRVERALGRWVVHEHTLVAPKYDPARAEAEVLERARSQAQSQPQPHVQPVSPQNHAPLSSAVYEQFRDSIRAHAETQKELLKIELDARRAALQGVLNDKHAKAVNNQKSAHLSKFLAAQIANATDLLVQWLVAKCYD